MFQSTDYSSTLSLKLSEVLEDIGVNEKLVMKRRRMNMLGENIHTVVKRSTGHWYTLYYLGSRSEGTTTMGLESDLDILNVKHDINVIQDLSEWKQNKRNYLMIQNDNVTPGYCFLQLVRSDVPLLATHIPNKNHISDSYGRILLRNTLWNEIQGFERQGPAHTLLGVEGQSDMDIVYAFPCNSMTRSASHFLERQGIVRWASSEMIRYAASNGCFVVGTSSKISTHPDLEWRISTSLAERCLMFNLNIIQFQCYVLMTMILKTFLNPRKENGMSSFMCKTVLLHCIENTDQNIWVKNNVYTCVTYCLIEFHSFLQNENCPHFMMPENNLMVGQFTVEEKRDLLQEISDMIQSDGRYLLRIHCDDISDRLQIKLNASPHLIHDFPTPREIHEKCSSILYFYTAKDICSCQFNTYSVFQRFNITNLKQIIWNLKIYSVSGNRLEQLASRYLIPLFCSTLGSSLASSCIRRKIPVSSQALMWLTLGLSSNITSDRLRLASVFYCTGDLYRAEFILGQIEREYNPDTAVSACGCCDHAVYLSAEFRRKCSDESEYCVTQMTLFCIIFLPMELNCVPRELQYEMMRSTRDDMPYRNQLEKLWMDFAVIDSPPYLYFLQYKTYGCLQRYQDQQHALNNLVMSIVTGDDFGHRETALNLLGQCMEQENKPREALKCYMLSLKQRARNNAAKFHICKLLAKCVSNNA